MSDSNIKEIQLTRCFGNCLNLEVLENKMLELAREKNEFKRIDISKAEATKYFTEKGDEYKLELIEDLVDGQITFYEQGKFTDLCKGPHVPNTGFIKAAKILSDNNDIIFKLSGDGVTKSATEELTRKYKLKNVKFLGWLYFKELLKNIDQSDVCLCIFGDISKASYSVTNKNYQILCSQKPLITRESPAMNEINAENGKNCILIPPNNPEILAEAILYLKNNVGKRKEISLACRKKYVDELSIEVTSIHLVNYLNELLKSR